MDRDIIFVLPLRPFGHKPQTGQPLLTPLPKDCTDRWGKLVAEPKTIGLWPDWLEEPSPPKRKKLEESSVVSREAGRFILVVPLNDGAGVTIEGVRLRLHVPTRRLEMDMTATMESLDWQGEPCCIARLDANPTSPHTNSYWRKLGVAPRIDGTHLHPFGLNAKLGREAFAPGNLPVAEAMDDDIRNFRDFLRTVGKAFSIADTLNLPSPPWNEGFQF